MSLMRWDPTDFDNFRADMNRLWTRMREDWNLDQGRPRTHLHRTEDGYLAKFELAGVDPDSVNIEVDIDSVTVSGQFPAASIQRDHPFGEEFSATVNFPGEIDPETAEAESSHGLLTVRAHRSQAKRRQLNIAKKH